MHGSGILAFATAALAGAAVWAVSPLEGGHAEPWDGGLYYGAALGLVGLLTALVVPKPLWTLYVGSIIGQGLYRMLILPTEPLFLLGFGFLLLWTLLFLGGAYGGALLRPIVVRGFKWRI